jgi:hypothetical protein
MWSSAGRRNPFAILATAAVGTTTQIWAVAALVLLGVAAVVAFRRRLHDVVGLTVVALLSAIGAVLAIRGMAIDQSLTTLGYVNVIFYGVGFIVWLALAWAAWRLLVQPWAARHTTSRTAGEVFRQHRPVVAATSIVLLLVASIAMTGWISHSAPHVSDAQKYSWRQLASIDKQLLHVVERGDVPKGRVALDLGGLGSASFEITGAGYQLISHGWTPTISDLGATAINDPRFDELPTDAKLIVARPGSPALPGTRQLGTLRDPATNRHFNVYYQPGSG